MNPNSAYDCVFKDVNLSDPRKYPRFIHAAKFENFRHIPQLELEFKFPITVISGSNKAGKTTALLSIACSHLDFKKRNYTNGKLERQTWSNVLKFTNHDIQTGDWTYQLQIKSGEKVEWKHGQRKMGTKKWSGLGKKESQIKGVNVVYLDLDRILPARHHSPALHRKAKAAVGAAVGNNEAQKSIEHYLSFVLEEGYSLSKLADHHGRDLFGFSVSSSYSSYNSASGEDVLSRILIDCVEAPKNSLILIDELELGLHPKVQRRLMSVLFDISSSGNKQFIITSHSSTVLSSVPDGARVFIESKGGSSTAICPISINAALSKMDSESYPLLDIFCEDETAKRILQKALRVLELQKVPGISSNLINVIESGAAEKTYQNFQVRERIFDQVRVKSGHACVLDGDMRKKENKDHGLLYPPQDGLYFLYGDSPPEKFLCDLYERAHGDQGFRYHIDQSNVHSLFGKMVEVYGIEDKRAAFEACWEEFAKSDEGKVEIDEIVKFILSQCRKYSPDL
jgi:predicted ATPase